MTHMKDIIKKAIEANLTTEEYINAMDEAHEHFDAIQRRQIDKDFHNEIVTEGRVYITNHKYIKE